MLILNDFLKKNIFLALRIEDGDYILNDKHIMQRQVLFYPGLIMEYSGPETSVERLNTSRPINVNLILEVWYDYTIIYEKGRVPTLPGISLPHINRLLV